MNAPQRSSRPQPTPALRRRLASALAANGGGSLADLSDPHCSISLAALATRTWVDAPDSALAGRCVLIRTRDQLNTILALVSLDGIAARVILCPPDLHPDHLGSVIDEAGVDIVVGDIDDEALPVSVGRLDLSEALEGVAPAAPDAGYATEWVLFTSGTAGPPKMAVHRLEGLTGAISPPGQSARDADAPAPVVWSTFYDIRRYGGLQILLRALVGGRSMVLSASDEPVGDFLERLRRRGATHISGTPSHWRRALMSPALKAITPRYVRLSGEIADQAVLDALKSAFPEASVGHAYASTEAGVGFEVVDGLEGFPADLIGRTGALVEMRIVEDALQLRSIRAATRYLGATVDAVAEPDGFVDTGDLVERRGDRFHFVGRRSGVVNIGGLKVHPEEVEAVINGCACVRLSRVKGRRSPITGAILVAEAVLRDPAPADEAHVRNAILAHCRAMLPPFKVPTSIRFVDALALTAGGKLERHHA